MATIQPFRSACFFSVDGGATVQKRASASEEQTFPLPAVVTNLYRFDESGVNNAALVAAHTANATRFKMAGSAVLVDDLRAEFDPPGLLYRAMQNAGPLYSKLANTPDALSREEQAQVAAISFRAVGLLG